MSITEKMRKVFDACTVMAGVEPDFECVYMTKGAALLYLDEIDAENDRLREERDMYRDSVDYMVHPDVPDQLAADTIWELRDDLQRANADNAKLREEIEAAKHDLSIFSGRIVELDADNAKLRELVRDMYKAFMHGNCYRWCEFKEPCNYISDGKCQWYDRMRELGVEVTS